MAVIQFPLGFWENMLLFCMPESSEARLHVTGLHSQYDKVSHICGLL